MMAQRNITDRAERYRAQKNVTGPRKCVMCASTKDLGVMHLDGNESHGESANLAYGCRSCNGKLSAAFKKVGAGRPTNQYNPAKGGVPSFEQYMWAVSNHSRGAHDAGGAVIHATPKHKRIEYARRIASKAQATKRERLDDRWNPANPWPWSRPDARKTTPASGGIAYHMAKAGKRPAAKSKAKAAAGVRAVPDDATIQEGFKRGLSLREILGNPAMGDGEAGQFASRLSASDRAKALKRHIANVESDLRKKLSNGELQVLRARWSEGVKRGRKRNPARASAEVFEEFHGFAPSEVITVTKRIHHHEHLAAAGKLVSLDVWGIDGRGHRISGFKGAYLAFNESKNQLFVEGGDQAVNLEDFGIDPPHELETLGQLTDIGYQTNKTHLGDEGGEAVYVHKFRSTNENGKHVVVKIARYPDLIYDVRNEQLLFSGGSYEILREGINK